MSVSTSHDDMAVLDELFGEKEKDPCSQQLVG